METIIQILGAACIGHILADFFSQFEKIPNKPLKCNMCLTFWTSFGPFIFIYGIEGILYAAISAITSEFIFKNLY